MATGTLTDPLVIDCSRDWIPQIDVERPNSTTGELEAYSSITGVTLLISATRGSSTPIHANLSKAASERSATAGRIYATFDEADLRTHLLAAYRGQHVWLNVYKSGELTYEPFRCVVAGDQLGIGP